MGDSYFRKTCLSPGGMRRRIEAFHSLSRARER